MKLSNLSILASPLALVTLSAFAHSGATGVVLDRMNGMTAMRDAMSELSPMMQGLIPYDSLAVSSLAATIGDHSGSALLGLFPEGSLEGVTYARAEIWSDWQTFESLANQLRDYSAALSEAAPNGLAPSMPMDMGADGMSMPMVSAPTQTEDAFSVAELLGYAEPEATKQSSTPVEGTGIVDLAVLPVPQLFEGISNACSSCHAQFRMGRN